ncbi:three-helix bundle dimerization domain-containing protein [Nocardia paucivorans]|uniref:three-helix bundle dimerization domain-containing protein n=1 Tax=Nocardia paucivorans TaxID=114259 RepID=UPI0002DD7909|nr:hypothetical protein [Nocardia paucivorans]
MELDTVREEKAIRELENRLVKDYTETHSPDRVGAVVHDVHKRFEGMPVRDFVPILVERIVRRELEPGNGPENAEEAGGSADGTTKSTTVAVYSNKDNENIGSNSLARNLPDNLRAIVSDRRGALALAGAGVLAAGAAVWAATRSEPDPAPAPVASATPTPTLVSGVVGSEKIDFFTDPRVVDVFDHYGLRVEVHPAGSREIATSVDLSAFAFAFPAGLPAAQRLKQKVGVGTQYSPFHSPMAIATFGPIVDLLNRAGAVKHDGPVPTLDIGAYLDMVARGTRWADLEGNTAYPVRKNILISTTDARTSNSAAMYVAAASYVLNENAVVRGTAAEQHVLPMLRRLFGAQGYTEDSSRGPFEEYLTVGMGAVPMVWIYEAQYVAATVQGRIRPDMVLLYPSPTVYSRHILVPLDPAGERVGELLSTDTTLQALAAEHGFRTGDTARFAEIVAEHQVPVSRELYDVVDIPAFDTLEHLLDGVAAL